VVNSLDPGCQAAGQHQIATPQILPLAGDPHQAERDDIAESGFAVELVRAGGKIRVVYDGQGGAGYPDPIAAETDGHDGLEDVGDGVSGLVRDVALEEIDVPLVQQDHEIAPQGVGGFPRRLIGIGEQVVAALALLVALGHLRTRFHPRRRGLRRRVSGQGIAQTVQLRVTLVRQAIAPGPVAGVRRHGCGHSGDNAGGQAGADQASDHGNCPLVLPILQTPQGPPYRNLGNGLSAQRDGYPKCERKSEGVAANPFKPCPTGAGGGQISPIG
jgi:hypothetical protein